MPPRSRVPQDTRTLTVRTDDGVQLAGIVLPARPPAPPRPGARALTFVVAHGFTNSVTRAPERTPLPPATRTLAAGPCSGARQ